MVRAGNPRPLADVEIVYGYRLRQMLADTKPVIAPLDQDAWARNLNYLDSPPSELVAFYGLGRHHNLRLLRNLKASRRANSNNCRKITIMLKTPQ